MSFMCDLYILWHNELSIQCYSQPVIDKYFTLHPLPASAEHDISLQRNLSSDSKSAASLHLRG